jgi:hypothetical protein
VGQLPNGEFLLFAEDRTSESQGQQPSRVGAPLARQHGLEPTVTIVPPSATKQGA